MRADQIMTPHPATCTPGTGLREVLRPTTKSSTAAACSRSRRSVAFSSSTGPAACAASLLRQTSQSSLVPDRLWKSCAKYLTPAAAIRLADRESCSRARSVASVNHLRLPCLATVGDDDAGAIADDLLDESLPPQRQAPWPICA